MEATERELVDYRTARPQPEEAERHRRLMRGLLEHGVLVSPTGLGCLSTPMADTELEGLAETLAAMLDAERIHGG